MLFILCIMDEVLPSQCQGHQMQLFMTCAIINKSYNYTCGEQHLHVWVRRLTIFQDKTLGYYLLLL